MRESREDGFTLVELVIVMTCMAVLAAIAMPKLGGYLLEANLNSAKPYLMEIAAKQRMHRIETGKYCCTGYAGFDESTLTSRLGLSLEEAGDFCFAFICRDGAICESTTSVGFIAPSAAAPDFEVWAILRNAASGDVVGPGSVACTPLPGKATPTGWVSASAPATRAGRAGQVAVLRYPPINGRSAAPGTYHSVIHDWRDGFSASDALHP